MQRYAVKLEQSGRILIPAEVRRRLGLRPGQDVLITAADDSVTVEGTRSAVIKQIQEELRAYSPGRVLSEELMEERRAEAARESGRKRVGRKRR
jgi:AbrB family looped-hinge helix DNA binding protein